MNTEAATTSRAYEDRDLATVCALLNLCDAVDNQEDFYTVEELQQRFATPSLDRFNDQRVWEDAGSRIVGFAQTWNLPSDSALDSFYYFRVHPDMRSTPVGSEMIDWASGHAHEAGLKHGLPAVLMGRVFDYDVYSCGLFEQHGFAIARYGLRMARSLHEPIPVPAFPQGYTLRHVGGEEDIEPWVDCFNQSFIDHWLFHPETVEDRRHRLQRPGYRPEQDLVAVAPDGSFAAFCLWGIDEADNARRGRKDGWIGLLGTRRGHRGLGLGRAMLLAGLQRLRDEGADTAKLGVDAENPTGALGLYERAGFRKVATRVSYHKDV